MDTEKQVYNAMKRAQQEERNRQSTRALIIVGVLGLLAVGVLIVIAIAAR